MMQCLRCLRNVHDRIKVNVHSIRFSSAFVIFLHKIFEQNFYQYVYLVQIWTNKNAYKKAHTFSRRCKNAKKRTKTDQKRMLR